MDPRNPDLISTCPDERRSKEQRKLESSYTFYEPPKTPQMRPKNCLAANTAHNRQQRVRRTIEAAEASLPPTKPLQTTFANWMSIEMNPEERQYFLRKARQLDNSVSQYRLAEIEKRNMERLPTIREYREEGPDAEEVFNLQNDLRNLTVEYIKSRHNTILPRNKTERESCHINAEKYVHMRRKSTPQQHQRQQRRHQLEQLFPSRFERKKKKKRFCCFM